MFGQIFVSEFGLQSHVAPLTSSLFCDGHPYIYTLFIVKSDCTFQFDCSGKDGMGLFKFEQYLTGEKAIGAT